MTEQSLSEFHNFKIQAPTAETQKRKKTSKKKVNEKTSNVRTEALEDPIRGILVDKSCVMFERFEPRS